MNNVQFTVCFIVLSFLCFSPLSEVHATPVHNYALYYSEAGQGVRVFDSDSIDVKDSMTIEAWVKPDIAIYDKASYIISKQLRGTGYMLRSTGYDRGFLFEAKTVLRGTTPEPIDEWVHVAGVYGSGSIRLYVNGILDAEQIAPIPLINEQDLYIGHSIFGNERNWRGFIDEVRIWNIAKTEDEIISQMHQELSGSEIGLAG